MGFSVHHCLKVRQPGVSLAEVFHVKVAGLSYIWACEDRRRRWRPGATSLIGLWPGEDSGGLWLIEGAFGLVCVISSRRCVIRKALMMVDLGRTRFMYLIEAWCYLCVPLRSTSSGSSLMISLLLGNLLLGFAQ